MEAPGDLGPGVGSVADAVGFAEAAHLVAGIRLRDPAGAGSLVARSMVPVAFGLPELVETLKLRCVVPAT